MATVRGKIWMRYFISKNALDLDIEDTIPDIKAYMRAWPDALNSPTRISLRLIDEIHEAD